MISAKRRRPVSGRKLRACLDSVFKPGRYIGAEINTIRKDPSGKVLFGLVYPDLYDLGMANLSLMILYDLLNRLDFVSAERAFLPDLDMQKEMKKRGLTLWSLENRLPLGAFDFIGFTIQSELCATNILQTLHLAGLNPLKRLRKTSDPIVIAGGPTLSNPEPYSDFIDLFLIGDAETVLPEVMRRYKEARNRREFFDKIREMDGIYIPSDWRKTCVVRKGVKKISGIVNIRRPGAGAVKTSLVQDLDSAVFPTRQIVPLLNIPQNRAVLEVSRGCLNNCRFCQAGYFYRPLRERSLETLERLAVDLVKNTGHSTISMLSLSISNYSNLTALIADLSEKFREQKVTLSLPSLRIDAFGIETLGQYKDVKKTGLTFALESMSPAVRRFLNKDLDMDAFRAIVKAAVENRWKNVKIYLMWGFPVEGEVEENIRGMLDFADFIRSLGRNTHITFHVTPFIPKPATPLQWLEQARLEKLEQDLLLFKKNVRRKNVDLKWHDLRMARFEAVLTKADRDMGKVILAAWRSGAMFDAWDDRFKFDIWEPLLREYEAGHRWEVEDILPWSHIDFGYRKDFFRCEYERSIKGLSTDSCREGDCYDCGVCTGRGAKNVVHEKKAPSGSLPGDSPKKYTDQDPFYVVELKFLKKGLMKFISHLDLIHLFEKALNVSGLNIRTSFGFSPHKKMSFPFPLALGIESVEEILVVELREKTDLTAAAARMNAFLPADLAVTAANFVENRKYLLAAAYSEYEAEISFVKPWEAAGIRSNRYVAGFSRKKRGWLLRLAIDKNLYKVFEENGIKRNRIRNVVKTKIIFSEPEPAGTPPAPGAEEHP